MLFSNNSNVIYVKCTESNNVEILCIGALYK